MGPRGYRTSTPAAADPFEPGTAASLLATIFARAILASPSPPGTAPASAPSRSLIAYAPTFLPSASPEPDAAAPLAVSWNVSETPPSMTAMVTTSS